jgi:transposase InsO family protein
MDIQPEKQWFTAAELVGMPDMPSSARHVNRMAGKFGMTRRQRKGRAGAWEYPFSELPELTQAHIILQGHKRESASTPSADEFQGPDKSIEYSEYLWKVWEAKKNTQKQAAESRLEVVQAVAAMIKQGAKKGTAIKSAASRFNVSAESVRRWMKLVDGLHRSDWLPALSPNYQGRQVEAEIPVEAWELFKALYLRVEKPTARHCYNRVAKAAKENGWTIPSLKTFIRKLNREVLKPVVTLAREGEEALQRSYPAQQRDKGALHALQAVNSDGHKFDVFVKWPDGEILRPVMVAFQDVYSGKLLSYRVGKTESAELVRLAFGDMVEKYGIPEAAYLDNGRAYASKLITGRTPNRYRFKIRQEDPTGIMVKMGVEVHWAEPYHGQSKPIERAFGIGNLSEYVSKHPHFAGAYTGRNPAAKPENYGSKAVPLEVFLPILKQEVANHNARLGRRSTVCSGSSFEDVFNESYEKSVIRKASEAQRRLWLLAAENVTASRTDGSIQLMKNRYHCERLAQFAGSKVVVRFDPDNLHGCVYVETPDGDFIGQADCIQPAGFADTQAATEHNRQRNHYRKAIKAQLAAERKMEAIEAAIDLPEAQAPPPMMLPKIIRPKFDDRSEEFERAFRDGLKRWKSEKAASTCL